MRSKLYFRCLVIFLLIFSFCDLALADGGWPRKKGKGYFKLSEWWVISDQHYTDSRKKDPNTTTGLFNTSIYAEWGFTDRLTGILYFPFFSRTYMNNLVSATTGNIIVPGESVNSIGDTEIGIKYGLSPASKSYSLTATFTLGLPLGEDMGGTEKNLQTGDGEFNQILQLDLGLPFTLGKSNAYTNLHIGINNRTNDFSDEIRFGIEAGAQMLKNRLWVIGRLHWVESLRNGKTAAEITTTSVFANNMEFTSAGAELAWYVTDHIGVAGGITYPLSGEIILAAPSFSVGLFLDMK